MELREFVTKAVVDIVEGVEDANLYAYRGIQFIELGDAQRIVFDVAVSVEEASSIKGQGSRKGGIWVLTAGPGTTASRDTESLGVTRIRFGVHVDRPTPEQVQQKAEMLKALRTPPRHR
jgi:hypothetical protein